MPDTHDDYPLAEVLGSGDLIHHARTLGLFGSRIETRCGLRGRKTGRDGGVWCPECKVRQPAAVDTHDAAASGDESGPFRDDLRSQLVVAGTEAAEQWLTDRANRKMSGINRRRLAGHVVNALWSEIERAAVEMAQYIGDQQVVAVTARVEKAERQRDEARTQLAELGEPETEYRFLLADGRESEFELHNEGPCGCRREQRSVRFGTWHAASVAAQDSPSDTEPCRGCGETYCDDSREMRR